MTTEPIDVTERMPPSLRIASLDLHQQHPHVPLLAAALAARGHRVASWTRTSARVPAQVTAPGVLPEQVAVGPPQPLPAEQLLPYAGELGAALRDRWAAARPDVVHAHGWLSGFVALVAARGLDLPVVLSLPTLAGDEPVTAGRSASDQRRRIERAVARDATALVADCLAQAEALTRLGVARSRVTVVPRPVDTDLFSAHGPVAARDRRPRVVLAARDPRRAGLVQAVRALGLLPAAELVVAGDCTGLGARPPGRVVLLGPVTPAAMPALLRSADVVVAAPRSAAYGSVVVQAMACGVPVVATEVGGLADAVVDGTTGDLVPPGQLEPLAHRLRGLVADPIRREAYGLAALDRVSARYTPDRVAAATEAVYADVLGLVRTPVG